MLSFFKILFSCILVVAVMPLFAQTTVGNEKIELVQADALEGGIYKGQEIRKLIGNVIFKQKESYLYCDSAYQYKDKNEMEAFGSIRITQGDSVTITGQNLVYNGNTKTARISGNVLLQDKDMTLSTPTLDYNMNTRLATYAQGGTITDPENQLNSKIGAYNTGSKVFTFKKDVVLQTKDARILSDTLQYNSQSFVVTFLGKTSISNEKGTLIAERGTYNTKTKKANFTGNSQIETPEYTLKADTLLFNELTGYGLAKGHVKLFTKKDSILVTGGRAEHWRERGLTKVYKLPVLKRPGDGDTLFLAADTLISYTYKPDSIADITLAYPNVRIYRSDLQGRCDSLSYNSLDSAMVMHYDPILWNNKNQIEAEYVRLFLKNKKVDRIFMEKNAFVISEDTLRNYNQLSGRNITGYFKNNQLRRILVDGNAESIYYALQNDTAVTGLNRTVCSNMVIYLDSGKVKTISFLNRPEAKFIPPQDLTAEVAQLPGFSWRIKEKPEKQDLKIDRSPRIFADRKLLVKATDEQITAPDETKPVGKKTRREAKVHKTKRATKKKP